MKRLNLYIISFLMAVVFQSAVSQQSPYKFGDVNIENLRLTHSPLDSTAGAMVISNYGFVSYDYNFEIVFTHHIRLKIFNNSEFSRANVVVPYGSKDRIENLSGATYNLEGGKIVASPLHRKDVFDEKVNSHIKQKRFSLPNVREGSVIEYTYRVNYGEWHSLPPWYFQMDIPVNYSEYAVALPDYFDYKRITRGYIPIQQLRSNKIGHYDRRTFNLTVHRLFSLDIPTFVEEPYLDCKDDYIASTRFELNATFIPGEFKKNYIAPSYKALSKAWAESESFGKKLEKGKLFKSVIDSVTAGINDDKSKVRALYNYVRDSFELDPLLKGNSFRKLVESKRANPEQINMVLIAMLRYAGFDANAVKLSTREHGKVNKFYAISSNFNKTICTVTIDNRDYLLDPSNKNLPFDRLSDDCINGQGMVVSKDNFRWIDLDRGVVNKKVISAKLRLNNYDELTGLVSISRSGYQAIDFREAFKDDLNTYKTIFSLQRKSWDIKSHEITHVKNLEEEVEEEIEVEINDYVESAGDIVYLTPIVFGRKYENPFKSPTRKYPVSYGIPISETVNYQILIPQGYSLIEKPKPVAISLPGNAGLFIYSIQQVGNTVSVTSKFKINKTEFTPKEYGALREFYAQVVSTHAQQLVFNSSISTRD